MESKERNLTRHWAMGLGTEVAVFAGVLLVMSGVALLFAALAR